MKPSYEELEEQLNRSRRLCDAALANERVWETAMMQACGEDGPKSVADKFAELEQKLIESERYGRQTDITIDNLEMKLAQMAAENAGLNTVIQAVRGVADQSSGIAGWHLNGEIATWEEILPEIDNIETPATDAFLSEVRASAVEEFVRMADYSESVADGEVIVTSSSVFAAGHEYAAQLRKGVQS